MGLRNMYRLSDPRQHVDRHTYDRAVNIWGGEVCGGALATFTGSVAFVGIKLSERATEFSDAYYIGAGSLAVAGLAAVAHGIGRLQEIAQHDLAQPDQVQAT